MFAFKNIFSLVNSNSHCLFSAIMNGIASLGQYSAVILFHLTYQELSIQGTLVNFPFFVFFILTHWCFTGAFVAGFASWP